MGIEVREMGIDDIAEVFHLGEKLFTSHKHANLYRTWDEHEVIGLFQSDPELCFVADSDGGVGGFLLGTIVEKAGTAWNYGHVIWLGVRGEHQKAGVGKRLFDAFKRRMLQRGIRILVADTQADNRAALRFLRRQGFSQATEHVYMSLNLESSSKE